MANRARIPCLAVWVLASLAPAAFAASERRDAAIERMLDGYVFQDAPGCVVAVEQDGHRVADRAWGLADLEHNVPITPQTRFEAGSVAKQFTAAAVLLLVEDGKLSLTEDVRRYLPELPDYGATITIDHLLTHTSGLRDWRVLVDLAGWPLGTRAHDLDFVLMTAARQRALNHAPGAEFSYTNTGFNLLAIVVERASGQSLAEFSRQRIFEPLGMDATQWRDDFRAVIPDRAVAYRRSLQGYRQDMPFESAYGAGGLLTTANDLMRWNAALDSGLLLPDLRQQLEQPAVLSSGERAPYGRGLALGVRKGIAVAGHAGATAGYHAWTGRYAQQKLSLAMLCNSGSPDIGVLSRRLADAYLTMPQPRAAPPAAPQAPSRATPAGDGVMPAVAPIDAGPDTALLTGTYVSDEADATIVISRVGDRVMARPVHRARDATPLRHVQGHRYRYGDWSVEVLQTGQWVATGLVMSAPGARNLVFMRASPSTEVRP